MLIHWEESATTKTPRFAVTLWAQGGSGHRLCPASLRLVTMERRRPRPRFQTSVAAPHFAPATRRPLRAALETSATGCYGV